MKILMFGWEFPPQISGGLGTACYGLTKALIDAQVNLLFVVPKSSGKEKENFLIDASAMIPDLSASNARRKRSSQYRLKRQHVKERVNQFTLLEVQSYLRPYQQPVRTLTPATVRQTSFDEQSEELVAGEDNHIPAPLTLTGTYGENLFKEVTRYAEVAVTIASRYAFDVIHVHDWMTFPAGLAVKKKSGKPLVAHVHSTEFDRAGDQANTTILNIERYGLQQADRIIAVSHWAKQRLLSKYEIPEKKVTVIHNGVLPRKRAELFTFPALGSHFVTFLGRITHQKGPLFFVEAAHKVMQEFPDAHYIVAGAGDLLPQTIERVAQLNMSSNFHFTGFLTPEQVDQIWSITNVYVMPSVSEPFGITPLEAIQGGVPVILSNQSGVSEVMPHAIKVDFWNIKELAAAIFSVLRYESLSHVLRQYSQRHLKKLSWDKAAQDVKALYHELTNQN